MTPEEKEQSLNKFLNGFKSILIAYSGGVDSSLLLWAALRALGPDRVWAVTADSGSYADGELARARAIAAEVGLPEARHLVINTAELDNPEYAKNPTNRCYYCKTELFADLKKIADDKSIEVICDGANISDRDDFRPGRKAAGEMGVISPLAETGLTKDDIRAMARAHGLSFAETPAAACLSSRFPYGTRISRERLRQIDRAETVVKECGFEGFRVRYHGDVARLEMRPDDIERLLDKSLREKVIAGIRAAGFRFVALDLEGYRTGSLNRGLNENEVHDV